MKKINILIVAATFYKGVAQQMINSALKYLNDVKNDKYSPKPPIMIKHKIIDVPGVFEIPVVIARNIKKYDGVIALGCVIKGQTPHFDFISTASTNAIMNLSVDYKKPIGNGIITCLNMKQAKARIKKGRDAAKAIVSIISPEYR